MVDYIDSRDVKVLPLQKEGEGFNPYRTGYGRKIKTSFVLEHINGRKYRVYSLCYGNSGSPYIIIGGKEVFVPGWFFD